MTQLVKVIDNRVFLVGLDALYRKRIKVYERGRLRLCAQELATALSIAPANVAIEGYYAEEPALTEYFRLIRALQLVPEKRIGAVRELDSFRCLREVLTSPLFGQSEPDGSLFPGTRGALEQALKLTLPEWNVPRIADAAHDCALESTDFSLPTLACLAHDPVAIAALRETVVVYVKRFKSLQPQKEYEWTVDPVLESRAIRFAEAFNELFHEDLPMPAEENAKAYWEAAKDKRIEGRCVCIGEDPTSSRYYHWAIDGTDAGPIVRDFWDTEPWTTARCRSEGSPC